MVLIASCPGQCLSFTFFYYILPHSVHANILKYSLNRNKNVYLVQTAFCNLL